MLLEETLISLINTRTEQTEALIVAFPIKQSSSFRLADYLLMCVKFKSSTVCLIDLPAFVGNKNMSDFLLRSISKKFETSHLQCWPLSQISFLNRLFPKL